MASQYISATGDGDRKVQAVASKVELKTGRPPEILAPAGGREQFFSALNAGADAVYLGLKSFNARSRAQNFTLEDLRELVPLAHHFRMKVLVAVNILVKENELLDLVPLLAGLEEVGVDAIIVQDLGVARLVCKFFPGLRLHASTQLAVHNLAGVEAAAAIGFKRVVLARELTAPEIKRIRKATRESGVELEAFCHGSLCYSYSGLCFFSGSDDARSGNRGECAYTCRKPYAIKNEPGHGFLFSMRDFDTSQDLGLLVDAEVETLKIEGRKKDAQYVASVVKLYRSKLDALFGRSTLREEAPELAKELNRTHDEAAIRSDLAFSYQRRPTTFFLKNRYRENVIDLDNPTHLGVNVGKVLAVTSGLVTMQTSEPLVRFDGLKVLPKEKVSHAKPQDGDRVLTETSHMKETYENKVIQFSLRDFTVAGQRATAAKPGDTLQIAWPRDEKLPTVGAAVYKIRSAELKQRVEHLEKLHDDVRIRTLSPVVIHIAITALADGMLTIAATASRYGHMLVQGSISLPAEQARHADRLRGDMEQIFGVFGEQGFYAENLQIDGETTWFIPKSKLKDLKRHIGQELVVAYPKFFANREAGAKDYLRERLLGQDRVPTFEEDGAGGDTAFAVKVDRLEALDSLQKFLMNNPAFPLDEVVFEPKRAYLNDLSPEQLVESLIKAREQIARPIRLALPTVIRAWDEPILKLWLTAAQRHGFDRYEIGNIGGFELLRRWGLWAEGSDLVSDFSLYALNSEATRQLAEQGLSAVTLSFEDDFENMADHLGAWPWRSAGVEPQAILFKDIPLFIAEACSLTALHGGCPTAKVCGYRTLEIENSEKETFYVAHENCKSIVYAKKPYAITHRLNKLSKAGIRKFRIDFLTRPYEADEMAMVLMAAYTGQVISESHTANFDRTLL